MSVHWTEAYIGLPYAEGGQGPDAFNCWGFVRHVERARFGREIPAVPQAEGLRAIARAIRRDKDGLGWASVADRQTGDVVLMAHLRHPTHIGVWVGDVPGGAVLHCVAGTGSVLAPSFSLEVARWRLVEFFRPAAEAV